MTKQDPPGTVRLQIVLMPQQRQQIQIDAAKNGMKMKHYVLYKLLGTKPPALKK